MLATLSVVWNWIQSHFWDIANNLPFGPSGVGVALALTIILGLVNPRPKRYLMRVPFALIVMSILSVVPTFALHKDDLIHTVLLSLGQFFLMCSIGRSGYLLFVLLLLGPLLNRVPKILVDLGQVFVFCFVILITLREAGFQPSSLLTGSAVLTAVVGFALRDTLSHMVAGLALQADHPFDVGDWIQFDLEQSHIGKVVEISWRSTKVITLDLVEILLPNANLASVFITNFNKPDVFSRRSVYVTVAYEVPPRRVHQIILEAIGDSWGVLNSPAPSVVTNKFTERGIEYWIRFFTPEFGSRDRVDGGVRDRIWYALKRNGINLPVSLHSVELHQMTEETTYRKSVAQIDRRREVLRQVDLFEALPDEAINQLAESAYERFYSEGELIIRQGADENEMYIIERGEVGVYAERPEGGPIELARLGPGKFFGEMSLMTGERRTATVRSAHQCELMVVDRAALRPILSASPELATKICEALTTRQVAKSQALASQDSLSATSEQRSNLLAMIRDFFALGHGKED